MRYVVIALIILAAVAVLSVCGEVLCGACADTCCVRGDRSEPLRHILRRILSALGTGESFARSAAAVAVVRIAAPCCMERPAFALTPFSALRI